MKSDIKLLGVANPEFSVIPISPNDNLQIEAISSIVPINLEIEGIALDKRGDLVPFHFSLDVVTAVTLTTLVSHLGYQALLSVSVITRTSSIPDGACYVRLAIVQEQTRAVYPFRKLLSQGYVSTYSSIGYGSSAINGAPSNHEFLVNLSLTNPGIGLPLAYSISDYTRLTILAFRFQFATSAVAVTRDPFISITLPPGNTHIFAATQTIAISDTKNFEFAPGLAEHNNLPVNTSYTPLPPLILEPGSTLGVNAISIQIGDQISNIALLCLQRIIPFT